MTEAEQRRIREAVGELKRARRNYSLNRTTENYRVLEYERNALYTLIQQQSGLLADEQRVHRLANIGKVASMLLIPVGILALVGTILTGAVGAVADFAAGAGVVAAGGGFLLNRFVLSRRNMEEIQRREQTRATELSEAERELAAADRLL
ncbi:MAG: hypothetical protein J6K97_03705 [Clostridia bacterium]|nr:hypothetical protein [Spirochaetaceae bacterium]MBP3345289.1 hypothetical protein [Clostridia bacterium]